MSPKEKEHKLLRIVGVKMNDAVRKEFVAQGHHLTGAMEQSLNASTIGMGNTVHLIGSVLYYGAIVNDGVPANKIPYADGKGGGHSAYIQGLIRYAQLRFGASGKEAVSIAFAIAKKHKKEGMPTQGSYAFSATGQRTHFFEIVYQVLNGEIDDMISMGLDDIVEAEFRKTDK